MSTAAQETSGGASKGFDARDVEYLRHGGAALLARVYRPHGPGPFPLVLTVHGGAWYMFDRFQDQIINETLASRGIVVASLDFRMPPHGVYPDSVADINYAIRWFKSHAEDFGSRAGMVGILGSSSGGHLAMLAAMRPHDPRYAALPLPSGTQADAGVGFAVMCWPVIDPLGRFKYVRALKAGGPPLPAVVDYALTGHGLYWPSEAAMDEGSPLGIIDRREACAMPPVLYLQGTDDLGHPRPFLDRFVAGYAAAGGRIDLRMFQGEASSFVDRNAGSPAASQALDDIVAYVHAECAPRAT